MKQLKEYLWVTLGTIPVVLGIYFFKFPNNFSTGGVSGISIIFGNILPWVSPGLLVILINVVLLLAGFITFGLKFGMKTVYSSVLFSLAIFLLEKYLPLSKPLTNQPFLELIFAVILTAVGSAVLFNHVASTGGTDIVAMILKKYTSLDIGKALFISDAVIALSAGLVFGITTGLFSVLGLLIKSLMIDNVIESINVSKYFTIITGMPCDIRDYINKTLRRGATEFACKGTFSNSEKTIILAVVSRSQAVLLKKFIKSVDPHAFIIVSSTSNIIGKGFREPL